MKRYYHTPHAEPMRELNTTPLIDVLLVLLVMFLISLPAMTHKVPVNIPPPGPAGDAPPPSHRLAITPSGALQWDGQALANGNLTARLEAMVADPAAPRLEIDAHAEARYERVDQVLATVNRAGVTDIGFVGNDRYGGAF